MNLHLAKDVLKNLCIFRGRTLTKQLLFLSSQHFVSHEKMTTETKFITVAI